MSQGNRLRLRIQQQLRDIRRAFTPGPPIPGDIPHLIDPDRWQRLHSNDIKFALKETWRMYTGTWKDLRRKQSEAAAAEGSAEAGPSGSGASSSETKSSAGPQRSATGEEKSEVAAWVAEGAAHLAQAVRDPEARKKVIELGEKYGEKMKGVVDQFLAGYVEGKNEEIRKYLQQQQTEADKAKKTGPESTPKP